MDGIENPTAFIIILGMMCAGMVCALLAGAWGSDWSKAWRLERWRRRQAAKIRDQMGRGERTAGDIPLMVAAQPDNQHLRQMLTELGYHAETALSVGLYLASIGRRHHGQVDKAAFETALGYMRVTYALGSGPQWELGEKIMSHLLELHVNPGLLETVMVLEDGWSGDLDELLEVARDFEN